MLFLLVWVLGGVISLCACVAFAELGSMFPDSGGQYVYLREAYGDLPAFLYGWMLFSVANGGTIAALSVASAAYLGGIVPFISQEHVVFSAAGIVLTRAHVVALISIVAVTWINVVGLRWGTHTAEPRDLGEVRGHGGVRNFRIRHRQGRLASLQRAHGTKPDPGIDSRTTDFRLRRGLIAVFWAYDGWVYITWVAGEVKEPRRNVPLAMVLGVLVVGAIYIAMNMTYVYALPLNEIAKHETIAHAAATALFSPQPRCGFRP